MSNEILSITPADALIDEPRVIRVEGLTAGERITIASQTERAAGVIWRSQAQFEADAQGVVDLTRQAPLAGSYQEVSPMGLLWSQVPEQDNCRDVFADTMAQPLITELTVTTASTTLRATLTQRLMQEGVERI